MARVPQYNEQYRYKGNVAPSYYQNVDQRGILSAYQQNQSGAQFGAIGKALGQAGQALGQYVNDRQNANVEESINNLQSAFTEWQTEQSKLQGKDAMDSAQDYETWRQKKISEITQNLNEVERGRFNQKSQNMFASQGAWANKYGYQNEQSYLDDTHKASIATSHESMARNRNDPNFMASEIQRLQGLSVDYAMRKGMSEESAKAYFRETLTNGMVGVTKTMINENELGNAQKNLDKYKGEMDQETYSALSAQIKTKREALYKKYLDDISTQKAQEAFASFKEDPNNAISSLMNSKNVPKDAQEKAVSKLMSLVNSQNSIDDFMAKENLKKQKKALNDFIMQESDVNVIANTISTLPMEEQKFAKEILDYKLNGSDMPSDEYFLSELTTQVERGAIRKENFEDVYSEYQHKISRADWIKLKSQMQTAEKNNYARFTEEAFKAEAMNQFDDMTSSKATEIYQALNRRAYDMGITDPQEKEKFMMTQLNKIEVEETGGKLWNSNEDIGLFQLQAHIDEGYEVVVPTDFRIEIKKAIQAGRMEKLTGTEEEIENQIRNAYLNFLGYQ